MPISASLNGPLLVAATMMLVACGGTMPLTELIQATRNNRAETIRTLVAHGVDPDKRGGRNDWTPLMHAIHKNQRQAIRALLAGGANVNSQNDSGLSALIMAAGYGYTDIVKNLLNSGADPYLETEEGLTALAVAASGVPDIDRFTLGSCQPDTVRTLLEAAPDQTLPHDFWAGTMPRMAARLGGCRTVLQMIAQ